MEVVSLEAGRSDHRQKQNEYTSAASAHIVDKDSWQQVGLLLVTSFNCAYVLSFSNLMLAPLGWYWGLTCLIIVAAFAAYANWLLAGFHVIGDRRFIRYRDLMGYLFGKRMYYVTWFLQFATLLLGSMGFILLGGRALKEINSEFSDSPMRLQVYIVVTGVVYLAFAYFVPTISSMRNWLISSAILTVIYDAAILAILIKDDNCQLSSSVTVTPFVPEPTRYELRHGKRIFYIMFFVQEGNTNKAKDYNIAGNKAEKALNAFGAIAAILVCNTSGILPEIQSTVRKPVAANMRKAIVMQYTIGLAIYYGISIAGYWAYGASVSEYLPEELSGPTWAKVLINSTAFLQSIMSQHMFVAPIHEALDTKFQRLNEGMFSKYNLICRFFVRSIFFGLNILVTALFPFMGDFVNLFGSFTLFPLTFVFPSMIFLKIKGNAARRTKLWHMAIIVFSSLMSIITTAAAVRLIINNTKIYHFFADT